MFDLFRFEFQFIESSQSSLLFSSTMAVDTFFTITGLLLSIYQLLLLKKWVIDIVFC